MCARAVTPRDQQPELVRSARPQLGADARMLGVGDIGLASESPAEDSRDPAPGRACRPSVLEVAGAPTTP
jgi:hypothetical protein